MDAEEILSQNTEQDKIKRERLSAIVMGGNSKKFICKNLQLSDIDSMSSEEINKLYSRYENKLGASVTKTLGNSIINLFAVGVSKFFKVNQTELIKEYTNLCYNLRIISY